MLAVWLASRLAFRNVRLPIVVVALVWVISVVAGLVAVLTASSFTAIESGRRGDLSGYQFVLSPVEDDPSTHDFLLGDPDFVPLWSTEFPVDVGGIRTDAMVHQSNVPLEFGTLLDGRRPQDLGEATVSLEFAELSDVTPGDTVKILVSQDESWLFEVVGVHVIEDQRSASAISLMVDDSMPAGSPSRYLSNSEVVPGSDVDRLFQSGAVRGTTADSHVAAETEDVHGDRQDSYRLIVPLASMISILLWLVTTMVVVSATKPVSDLFQRLGMPRRQRWLALSLIPGVAGLIGALAGLGSARLMSPTLGDIIARRDDQFWTEQPFSIPVLLTQVFVGAVAVVGYVLFMKLRGASSLASRKKKPTFAFIAGALLVLSGGWGVFGAPEQSLNTAPFRFLVAGCALSAGLVVSAVTATRFGSSTNQVVLLVRQRLAQAALPTALVSVIVLVISVVSSGIVLNEAAVKADSYVGLFEGLPAGSLQVERLERSSADKLADEYSMRGGEAVVYEYPKETGSSDYRVVDVETVACFNEQPTAHIDLMLECALSNNGAVQGFATAWSGPEPKGEAIATPELLRGKQSGTIAVVEKKEATGLIVDISFVRASAQQADLDQSVASAVLTEQQAAELGIEPGGSAALGLKSLSEKDQTVITEMRALARQLGAGSVINYDVGPQVASLHTLALTISVVGATFQLLLLSFWSVAFAASSREAFVAVTRIEFSQTKRLRFSHVPGLTLSLAGIAGFAVVLAAIGKPTLTRLLRYEPWLTGVSITMPFFAVLIGAVVAFSVAKVKEL